jgi:hypothetical protein
MHIKQLVRCPIITNACIVFSPFPNNWVDTPCNCCHGFVHYILTPGKEREKILKICLGQGIKHCWVDAPLNIWVVAPLKSFDGTDTLLTKLGTVL